MKHEQIPGDAIVIRGARQNNLKNLTLAIPAGELLVVSGVSGSGKSSLVFDTLYAEGQRRYVETFSPYARQFLERMDKPQVDSIEGIPPAIAIDQTNPVRTSRSTVGTMTELNDHLKLLYARAARLYCRGCGKPVVRDTPESIYRSLLERSKAGGDLRLVVTFPVPVPKNFTEAEVRQLLERQGYTRFHSRSKASLEVIQDRLRVGAAEKARVVEALEAALRVGQGRVNVHPEKQGQTTFSDADADQKTWSVPDFAWRYSSDLHCPDCDIHYSEPTPAAFSFNSPIGACETCRGFGRVIGVDFGLVVPDESKTLREGAIRPWQTASFKECQDDLAKYAKKRGIPLDTSWRELGAAHRDWVLEGEREWVSWRKSWPGTWYGVRRFFKWLESKAYKMHIRVLLSRYRAYTECEACGGTRLKPDAALWKLDGRSIHDLMLLPLVRTRELFDSLALPAPLDEATDLLLGEIRTRLRYLCEVGLGYLTLDRQSRTLSGGEVQRINLTTALGTSLVNTLFVLDEPSIGLHPRDMGRVIDVMKRLRDAGNTLVVVEHDPQIMFAADRILDMGPGPGERGGEVVFFGAPEALKRERTLTAEYLSGRRRAHAGAVPKAPDAKGPRIELAGAAQHNLKNLDVSIPLGHLVCVTGVSGSGKSTLVQDVLYAALRKAKGKPTEAPGALRSLRGAELVADAVMVDQSPIGKTTRSNPASYVGAFDEIRTLFSRTDAARERQYTRGTFSFNSGNGRCPTCGGNGFEHVEMQFLSDVYLRCPDCDGRRFRAEVLEIRHQGKSIADVLELTVAEAAAFFSDFPDIIARLQPLVDVGLEYLRLGQPVPTLSGGEAQRLKLAGHLAEAGGSFPSSPRRGGAEGAGVVTGKLFLFDEPTTGLHFDDVAKLLRAFRKLIAAGHSLVVIEHNLDVVRASDWVIDLGPEGGEAGGELVCAGTPQEVTKHATSHTGKALREYEAAFTPRSLREPPPLAGGQRPPSSSIRIHNAREHNLQNIDVDIPRGRFTVVTGVSGSGKSTLAFDILFAEGQRRYLESLNAYARQFVQAASRPDVDAIFGIPPTVAIEQRSSRGGRKSTVGTLTEIQHFLRLLFVKLGVQHCPDCEVPIEPQSEDAIAARLLRQYRGETIVVLAPLVLNRKGVYTDLAKWAAAKGYSQLRVDGKLLPVRPFPRIERFKEHTIELPVGYLKVSPRNEKELRERLSTGLELGKGVVHVQTGKKIQVFSTKRACRSCGRSFAELDPRLFSYNSKHGWCPACYGTGLKLDEVGWDEERSRTGAEDHVLDSWIEWLEVDEACPECRGRRLNPEALAVFWRGKSIAEYGAMPVAGLAKLFAGVKMEGRAAEIARDL
ncbi:MAG: excinuclease ABC subunit A, partial [Betaproteobacteria bacterium RIFCSPHIGHO2_12_FULL_69_13]